MVKPKEDKTINGIRFIKNLNKHHGRAFYVAFRESDDEWIAKIYYDKNKGKYLIKFEDAARCIIDEQKIIERKRDEQKGRKRYEKEDKFYSNNNFRCIKKSI